MKVFCKLCRMLNRYEDYNVWAIVETSFPDQRGIFCCFNLTSNVEDQRGKGD